MMGDERNLCETDRKKVIELSTKLYHELGLETYYIDYFEFLEDNLDELDQVTVVNVVKRYKTFRATQRWTRENIHEYV